MSKHDLSIFAKPSAWSKADKHLLRGSSVIRGNQIAEYLGAKLNPESGFEDDVCIYVKPHISQPIPDGAWVDIVDGDGLCPVLRNNPRLSVIASSESSFRYLNSFLKNQLVLIPQHHCNFERVKREEREVKTVGFIGTPSTLQLDLEKLRRSIEDLGMQFVTKFRYSKREEIVDFYRGIDLQISWRTNLKDRLSIFKNPLRIVNAASFGIPTIALPEKAYDEFKGNFIPIETYTDLIKELGSMKNAERYREFSEKIVPATEPYHIENIAKLYKQLYEI